MSKSSSPISILPQSKKRSPPHFKTFEQLYPPAGGQIQNNLDIFMGPN